MNIIVGEKLKKLPIASGVYLMKNASGKIIYIGKAKILKNRVSSYFVGEKKDMKTSLLVQNVCDFDYIVTSSELDALILENNLIKKHQPHFNILLKDGKNYPYIKLTTKDDFPKVEVVRKIKKDGSKYFGPYFAGVRPEDLIETMNYAYAIRTCNLNLNDGRHTKRECLNYALGLCTAPCTGRIDKAKYAIYVNGAINFLNGKTDEIEKILTLKMENAARLEKFETAIKLREKLKTLDRLKQRFTTQFTNLINIDIIGYYNNGISISVATLIIRGGKMLGCDTINLGEGAGSIDEVLSSFVSQYYSKNIFIPDEIVLAKELVDKAVLEDWLSGLKDKKVNLTKPIKGIKSKLLGLAEENAKEYLIRSTKTIELKKQRTFGALDLLKEKLQLNNTPYRIECYDISNISGTDKVASMVVFINGEKATSHYRKFKIKTVEGTNDFASMEEVLRRRFLKLSDADDSFSSLPDLVVVDGGKGQLSSAQKAIASVGNFKTQLISLAKREEEVFKEGIAESYILPKTSYGLQLLQRLRDEAHRFAITYHRTLRDKKVNSVLDKIEGIGPKKRVQLLKYFKSIKNLSASSVEEITKVKGINKELAIKILQFLDDN
ncbi:MAG: excinuclease ABC subunit UvrC [Clostridia bacterium]|nr:excinuclease ABC subunit UvrC [Clostridia bacterium]